MAVDGRGAAVSEQLDIDAITSTLTDKASSYIDAITSISNGDLFMTQHRLTDPGVALLSIAQFLFGDGPCALRPSLPIR